MKPSAVLGLLLCVALPLVACERDSARSPPPRQRLSVAFEELSPQAANVDVSLLDDAPRSFAARWRLLDDADRAVDTAYFIIDDDCFGLAFLGRLHEKAREGVQVRLLVDARGSKALKSLLGARALLETLGTTPNAAVRVFNPPLQSLDSALTELSPLLPAARSHLKVLLSDDDAGIVGGRNIAANYFASPSELPSVAYDVDVLAKGSPVVTPLRDAFLGDFEAQWSAPVSAHSLPRTYDRGDELRLYARAMDAWVKGALGPLGDVDDPAAALEARAVRDMTPPPSPAVRERARPILADMTRYPSVYGVYDDDGRDTRQVRAQVFYDGSRADSDERHGWRHMLSLLMAAEREVHIESPYLVLTEGALRVLEALAHRGVDIHLYTNGPRSSDNDLSQALFIEAWPEVLARVATLHLYVSDDHQLMHSKRMVIDGKVTMIGTYNLDLLSALMNSEVMLAAWDERFANENQRLMENRRSLPHVRRYEIFRDHDGRALRHPKGHAREGRVIVRFGPEHHIPPEKLEELLLLREVVTRLDHFADLEPAAF